MISQYLSFSVFTQYDTLCCCCCCCCVASVVPDSVRPHRRQPTRLPLDSPGKNAGVGCHFLLQCMKVKSEREVAQSCPTPSNPMECSLPGSSVHGIFQAKVLEWVAIAFSNQGSPDGKIRSPSRKLKKKRSLKSSNFDHELLSAMAQCLEVWPLSR